MFVFETESQKSAEPKPKDRWTTVDDPNEQINASHPEQRLKRVHREKIADRQTEQRTERARAGERNRPRASAQCTRDQPSDRNRRSGRQRWEKTNGKQRVAKENFAQSQQQDRQWRLVYIPESEMPTAGDVVELVAKITIATVCQEMNQEGYRAEENQQN